MSEEKTVRCVYCGAEMDDSMERTAGAIHRKFGRSGKKRRTDISL